MVVTIGVAIASYGEINFVVIGVVLQLVSIVAEALRLSLVQVRDRLRSGLHTHQSCCPMRIVAHANVCVILVLEQRLKLDFSFRHSRRRWLVNCCTFL